MRNHSLTQWAIFSAPLLILLAIVWFGFQTETDVAVFFEAHRAAHPLLKTIMKAITDWSNPVFYGIYAIMLITALKTRNRERLRFILVLLVVQGIVAGLCVHFLKMTIGRPRPGQGTWFEPLTTHGSHHSLPSGHTTEITGWTLPLVQRLNQKWVTLGLGLYLGIVGFSRIYLGWHHPSDVFFAWLLGSLGGFATSIITSSTLFRKKAR
ncbi:phosphatase PAP2 family protein [Pseudodesulfovibrio sp. JC047]|uniref:phosphatase PAP2 family protein n=1 Tax=Pseudodesulfovibrio sp. JC047 TaxID=2683199 RepID=UPI0013D2DAA8|nr:phosphatase PAP2 family protein [Pseudodesulfovibrio sp. JC047]NDV20801.1 phosphatase PAP2 family protein [Pseudodesulfovibrio sp. JC047]